MSRKFNLEKQPDEKLTIGIDFTLHIASGEIISSAVVSAINLSDGTDAGSIVLDGLVSFTDTIVSHKLKAGETGERFKITFLATTDAPHDYEADVIMTVMEL